MHKSGATFAVLCVLAGMGRGVEGTASGWAGWGVAHLFCFSSKPKLAFPDPCC